MDTSDKGTQPETDTEAPHTPGIPVIGEGQGQLLICQLLLGKLDPQQLTPHGGGGGRGHTRNCLHGCMGCVGCDDESESSMV